MNHAVWKDVWSLVVSLIGREAPPVQIFLWLVLVFAVLMMIEGLRATFLPRRVVAQIHRRGPLPARSEMGRSTQAEPAATARNAFVPRSRSMALSRNAKRSIRTIKRQEPSRPTIRRVSSYFEFAEVQGDQLVALTEN
jgi:hypothetical protein